MKVTSVVFGLCAAFVAAAPAEVSARTSQMDYSSLNNMNKFNSMNIQYINNVNNLDMNLFAELSEVNHFNVFEFQTVFQSSTFNLQSILQLCQMQTLLEFASKGLFNGIDLSDFSMSTLNLGLMENIGTVDLSQFVQQSSVSQMQVIAAQTVTIPAVL